MAYPSPSHFNRSRSLQPRLQNGASAVDGGLPHNGQDLAADGMAASNAERWVGTQGHRATDLPRQCFGPRRKHRRNYRGVRDELDSASLTRGPTEQSPCFERRPVECQLEQAGVAAWTDDLEETEAIDRGSLERLRKDGVDRRDRSLPRGLVGIG